MSDELDPIARDVVDGDEAAQQTNDAKPVSRRAALKVIGSVPIAGAMMGGTAFAQQSNSERRLTRGKRASTTRRARRRPSRSSTSAVRTSAR